MIEILNGDDESINRFHDRGWGRETLFVTEDHIKALQEGKALGIDDGEYTHVLVLRHAE
jgi:hypothetical protein